MKTVDRWSFTAIPLLCTLLAACGGKPAESPDSAADAPAAESQPATEAPESKPDAEPAAKTKSENGEPQEAKSEVPAADERGPGPTSPRTPKDILTAPDVIFMFSFNDSDMRKGAEEKCEAQSKGDAKKNADCMAKARKKVDHDGYRFKQQKGEWRWLTIRRNGNVLLTLHNVPFVFGEETKNTIVIKTTGKDTGAAPSRPPAQVTFEVPNDYQIVHKDSKQGAMVYEAKIGITGEGK